MQQMVPTSQTRPLLLGDAAFLTFVIGHKPNPISESGESSYRYASPSAESKFRECLLAHGYRYAFTLAYTEYLA
jgi:hypothetical protein